MPTPLRQPRKAGGLVAAAALLGALLPVAASATDTVPGGPAGATNVATKCFHVGVVAGGNEALKGSSRFVPKDKLIPDDKGFGHLDTKFAYGLRLRGTVYKKKVWSSNDHYWYFVPERFALGGNGTVTGGGQTVTTSGGNPTGQGLGSRTVFRLHSTKTSASYGMSLAAGVSASWESSDRIRKLTNTTWTSAGLKKTSGELSWDFPLTGSASRSSGLEKITVQSAAMPGGNGPAAYTSNVTWNKPKFYRTPLNAAGASFSGLKAVSCSAVHWTDDDRTPTEKPDTTAPVLSSAAIALTWPTSRTVTFSLGATDDSGSISQLRVRVSGEDWRPWVAYVANGTVVLPDRYGDSTVSFQVKDAAGNVSTARTSGVVTRVRDTGAPSVTGAAVSLSEPTSRYVAFSLSATDQLSAVTQMRVLVSGQDWRSWVPFASSGTVILPDGYGRFGITFQVADEAGNNSATQYAGSVVRTAAVNLTLQQIDNNGNVRSCGASDATPCSDVVKRFRSVIDSAVIPDVNALLKAWRYVNGAWVESSVSPFTSEPINGRRVVDTTITANLLEGIWRFQAQVPRDPEDITAFGASGYQYLRID